MNLEIAARALLLPVIAAIGFGAGWWARDHLAATDPPPAPASAPSGTGLPAYAGAATPPGVDPGSFESPAAGPAAPAAEPPAAAAWLESLLSQQRFEEATGVYYRAISDDAASAPQLYPIVQRYVRRCADSCEEGAFLALMDAWLDTFYDDVQMLLSLADYQAHRGQPEAAASTLLLAQTYGGSAGDHDAVQQALLRLSRTTDSRLAGDGRWVELLGYYEYLDAIDFSRREFQLRRVALHRHLGEPARAEVLLERLRAADDGSDPAWTAALQGQPEAPPVETPSAALSNAVPLDRRGSGYVVEVALNRRDTLALLVDTGASLTAISQDSFRRQYRPDFQLLGTRLFNTANGYTRGDVYLARSLTLGPVELQDVTLAVLELDTLEGVDGLLGMNVLRNFRFQIDQEVPALHLQQR